MLPRIAYVNLILSLAICLLLVLASMTKPSYGNSKTENNSVVGPLICEAVFLPLILDHPFAPSCTTQNNYCEENDLSIYAYGPLEPSLTYHPYMKDSSDYYYILATEPGEIIINVTNFQATSGQLQLLDREKNLLDFESYQPDGNMVVSHTKQANEDDFYYIWLSTNPGDTSDEMYTLTANFPTPPDNSQPPPIPPYKVLEEFTPDPENPLAPYLQTTWWTTIEDTDVFTYTVISGTQAMPARSGSHMFQIEYEKTDTIQFLGAELPEESRDLSWAEAIDVWVKGDVPLMMKIEEDGTDLERTLQTFTTTHASEWHLFRYDIGNLVDFDTSKVKTLKFFPAPGDDSASGTFYLDSILARANGGRLESFEPSISTLDWWSPDPQSFAYVRTIKGCNSSYALKIDVDKTDTTQYIGAELPSGFRDISQNTTLEFLVYGAVDIEVKLEEDNGNDAGHEETLGRLVSTTAHGWSQLRYDYSHVKDKIDLTKIRTIKFFPYPEDASASGTFYLDNIQILGEPE